MFPCSPPFFYSRIGEVVVHRSLDFVPKRFLQCTVTVVNEHAFTVPRISGEERAEPEFVGRFKAPERAHTSQKKRGKLAAFLPGFHQVAPLRSKNIDSRSAALLVLLSYLNSEVN